MTRLHLVLDLVAATALALLVLACVAVSDRDLQANGPDGPPLSDCYSGRFVCNSIKVDTDCNKKGDCVDSPPCACKWISGQPDNCACQNKP
jgi:hypothetical protein